MGANELRVFIADDDGVLRDSFARYLRAAGMDVVGLASTAGEAVSRVLDLEPDVLLIDLVMPGGSSADAVRTLTEASLDTRYIAFSAWDDPLRVDEILRAGAHHYVSKGHGGKPVLEAIMSVMKDAVEPPEPQPSILDSLSPREREVFLCVGRGLNDRAVAGALSIKETTVRTYVSRVMRTLSVDRRIGLTKLALRLGLVSPAELE